jgi:hypothetical protein
MSTNKKSGAISTPVKELNASPMRKSRFPLMNVIGVPDAVVFLSSLVVFWKSGFSISSSPIQ